MKNTIIIDDIPDHKASYLIGVLVGMKVNYEITPDSPLYRTMREFKRKMMLDLENIPRDPSGITVINET